MASTSSGDETTSLVMTNVVALSVDAKLSVATGCSNCQHLKGADWLCASRPVDVLRP